MGASSDPTNAVGLPSLVPSATPLGPISHVVQEGETLESILARRFDVIHVVGGGGKNPLLCQMTADATGRRLVVGPFEATATGNVLVQAMAEGAVRDLSNLRRVVAESFELTTYEPSGSEDWARSYVRFAALLNS